MSTDPPDRGSASRRRAELARLIPIDPQLLHDLSPAGRVRLLSWLKVMLAAERQRGLAGHWTYDLPRHAALAWLSHAEAAALAADPPEQAGDDRGGAEDSGERTGGEGLAGPRIT